MGLPFRSQSWPKMQVITCVGPCSSSQYRQKDLLPIKPQYSSSNVIDNIFAVCFSHLFYQIAWTQMPEFWEAYGWCSSLRRCTVERQKNKKQNKGCVHIIFKIMFYHSRQENNNHTDHCRKERKPQRSLSRTKESHTQPCVCVTACFFVLQGQVIWVILIYIAVTYQSSSRVAWGHCEVTGFVPWLHSHVWTCILQ